MTFRIYDGREKFYQWDIDRKIIVNDDSITQVHFCNKTSECSLVCEVREEGNLRVVDVPNILLQEDWSINVYGYDRYYTKFSRRFDVIKRSKPDSYVYTETEVLCYQEIMDKLDVIEDNIGQAIEDYLEENPLDIDMSAYALKEEIPTKVSELENDKGYLTQHQDLTAYAKKTDIPTKVSAFTNDAGYLTKHQDLSAYAKKSEIPSIEGLATEKYVDTAIANAALGGDVDLSDYYTKEEVNNLIPSTSGFITMAEVEAKGYQTAQQVSTAITTALSAIGVAEEGAY